MAPAPQDAALPPWRSVVSPHPDVARGDLAAGEFAADLHAVAFGTGAGAGGGLADPEEFFRRTFVTEGLRDLLDRAARRVGGDPNASPVITLPAGFGGGKTHALLALWHLLSGTDGVRRVALVGTHLSPTGRTTPDGTRVGTLWGELAWQLGGADGFALVAAADAARTSPGHALRDLVRRCSPCLILVDEWVTYARQLWGRTDLPAGTFDTQVSLAQTLTEAVGATPGALLVVSLPAALDAGDGSAASPELGGPHGVEALRRLDAVLRRVADPWRPAGVEESAEIVRRRLFAEPGPPGDAVVAEVARQFGLFYGRHARDVPREVGADPLRYAQRIAATYPLHPELLDRLAEDWSRLPTFHGTRGMLRLLGAVVHAQWSAGDPAALIMPGTLPLTDPRVRAELTGHLPGGWVSVLAADVEGPGAAAERIDAERPTLGRRATTRRLARSLFLGSAATADAAHRGLDRRRTALGTAVPGDAVANVGVALDLLRRRATHLYAEGDRLWFDPRPSVTRTAGEYADGLRERPEEVWRVIVDRLRAAESRIRGGFAGVHVAPLSSAEVPDADDVRLVVVHPSLPHRGSGPSAALRFAADALAHRGTTPRTNRNLVVFLAADEARLDELAGVVREFLAWDWVRERGQALGLSAAQASLAEQQRARADAATSSLIGRAYHRVIVPDQPDPRGAVGLVVLTVDAGGRRLADAVTDRLGHEGLLAGTLAPRSVRLDLDGPLAAAVAGGHVSVAQLWSYYCRHPYLRRLRDRRVLEDAVAAAVSVPTWEADAFALAAGVDEATGRYCGLVVPGPGAAFGLVTGSTLLVMPAGAARRRDVAGGGPAHGSAPPARPTRFVGDLHLGAGRHERHLARLVREVLGPLADADGVELEVTVQVRAGRAGGFPEETVRAVLENARTLRFVRAAFEAE